MLTFEQKAVFTASSTDDGWRAEGGPGRYLAITLSIDRPAFSTGPG